MLCALNRSASDRKLESSFDRRIFSSINLLDSTAVLPSEASSPYRKSQRRCSTRSRHYVQHTRRFSISCEEAATIFFKRFTSLSVSLSWTRRPDSNSLVLTNSPLVSSSCKRRLSFSNWRSNCCIRISRPLSISRTSAVRPTARSYSCS
jgi:hypothetical protein